MKFVLKEFECPINGTEDYTIKTTIGGGDRGSVSVTIPGALPNIKMASDMLTVNLGKGSSLIGKKILVVTVVTDFKQDNRSVVGIDINSKAFKTLTEDVIDHEVVNQSVWIKFVQQ